MKISSQWSLREDFRRNVHILIERGYNAVRERIKLQGPHHETDTTGFIAEAIEDWLNWSDDARGFDGFVVQDDPPERSHDDSRRGRGRQRSDLVILFASRPRPRFVCEAKRLKKSNQSGYTGSKGMGCFIEGEYARDSQEAAMLGYVEDKSVSDWKKLLQNKIDGDATKLKLIPPQDDVNVISEIDHEWMSKHCRDSVGSPIDIYHILLDCIPDT